MGRETDYTYTDDDLLATVTRHDPSSGSTFLEESDTYDAAGNLTGKVTGNGNTTVNHTVDAANRTSSTTVDPSGVDRTTTYSYTPDDAVATTTLTDPSGVTQTSSATYDPMGRMTSQTDSGDASGHPQGWWPLTQTSGPTVTDASGNGNTATVGTGATLTADGAVFNGSGYVATNGPVLNTASSYSVSAWVNLPTAPTTWETFVSQSDNGVGAAAFYLQYNKTNNAWEFISAGSDSASPTFYGATAGSPPQINTWTHLVGVFNSATGALQLYVNGALAATQTDPTPWMATGPLSIGSVHGPGGSGDFTTGSVQNVQVYPRALSAGDISALYADGRKGGTISSSAGRTTTYSLDQRGLATSVTDPNGNTTSYSYDEAGNETTAVLPTVNSEVNGGAASPVHPMSATGYNTFGEVVEQQDANGNVTTTGRDAMGNPVTETQPSYTAPGASSAVTPVTTRAYNPLGEVTSVTDPLGNKTGYTYDQLGDTATETQANSGVTHTVYDADGEVLSTTDPTGAQTTATYDYLGRKATESVVERTGGSTLTTTYGYNNAGELSSETLPSGPTTSTTYNGAGETTSTTDGAGNVTSYAYDLAGRQTAETAPDGTKTTTLYDAYGEPTSVSHLDATGAVLATTSATYDADGNALSKTDSLGHTSTFTYDATNAVTSETDPTSATSSITASFGYDPMGNRTRYTDGNGNVHVTTFNSLNLQESQIEPATTAHPNAADRTFTTAYDADSQATTLTKPGGVTVTSTYDNVGDMTGQSGSGADAATTARSFGYDLAGRMTSANTAAGNNTFQYNDRGELTYANGVSGTSSFTYGSFGQMTQRQDAAGTTSYTYDTAGRLSTIADPASGSTLTYSYNNDSLLSQVSYGSSADLRTYTYDGLHQLTGDTLKTSGGTTVASIAYGYDANGNETSKTTSGFAGSSANTYTYDWSNRLSSWNNGTTTVAYGYDGNGNRTQVGSQTFTYDARDELTSDGTSTYSYTARGTLASQTTTTGGTTTTSTSDAFDQAITYGSETYTYDALGRTTSVTGTGGATRTLSYTGDTNQLASDGTSSYTWDDTTNLIGIGTPGSTGGGTLAYTDQHTDVVGDFTPTSAALSGSTTYDPLGNVTATSNQAGNLGYQSGWTDHTNGRVNMDSRWYNPSAGQFTTRDRADNSPVPDIANANKYAYDSDNPLLATDPLGTFSLSKAWHAVKHAAKAVAKATISGVEYLANKGEQALDAAIQKTDQAFSEAYHLWQAAQQRAMDFAHQAASLAQQAGQAAASLATRVVQQSTHVISDAYRGVRNQVNRYYNDAKHIAARVQHAVTYVSHAATHIAATAYHATVHAATKSMQFLKNHAAAIASFAVSTVAFSGCDAALGAATGGVGAVAGAAACGAFSGALGSMTSYGVKAAESGKFSLTGLVESGVIGAATGAAGGVMGAVGGKVLSGVAGKAGSLFGGAAGDVAEAGAEDGASSMSGDAMPGDVARAPESDAPGPEGASSPSEGGGSPSEEAGGENAPGCPTKHSFVGSTQVLLADGSSKPISQIKVGDKIQNAAPGSSAPQIHTVDAVIVTTTDHDFVDVTVATPNGPKTITTTQHHKFYDATTKTWTEAGQLVAGDKVQTTSASTTTITAVRQYTATQLTYDLTIDGLHTYYVEAGTTPVLVHNCNGGAVDLVHLTDRADDLHSLIPAGGQGFRTTAVLHADGVSGGIDLSAVGARSNLTLIQRSNSVEAGELAISMSSGAHAEIKAVTATRYLDLSPSGIAASRPFCADCTRFLVNDGATIVSPRTALWLPRGVS